ncbi:nitroreductase family protein [Anaerofustis stercorihominis]|uniref:Diguanylate cyclase n=1 Tax=Anaerofustis stercorihominis TaxID=214853 RepID=A0A3E3E2Z0_9FIRM|nr:nitroreductase [Anaerofustis stercorihominis]RGD75813.1 diguanylate cyclase [Anaerofustis stercorihominis]
MSNAAIENILSRRSVRSYLDKQVSEEDLKLILKAGEYAPSGMGKQSPVIVAVQNKETIDKLVNMNAEIMGTNSNPYYGAPTIIIVLADKNVSTYIQDGSLALGTMMLAAHSLGISTCWINREYEMFNTKEGRELLNEWGVSDDVVGVGALALGYSKAEVKEAKTRKENYSIIIK